jgi:hypothetical protein
MFLDFSRFSAREGSATSATAGWLAFSGNFGQLRALRASCV